MEVTSHQGPRLSGKLWYGPPHLWEIKRDDKSITILPKEHLRGLVFFFMLLAALSAIAAPFVVSRLPTPDWFAGVLVSIGFVLGFLLCCVLIRAVVSSERNRGAILLISLNDRQVRLPRNDRSWPLDRILRWEVIYGVRVQRMNGKSSTFGDEISELQMVVDEGDGQVSVWPIIGALGHGDRDLWAAAQGIAEMTSLPWVVINDEAPVDQVLGT